MSDVPLPKLYEELADRFAKKGELLNRDQCLVLACHCAVTAGGTDEAERLRQKLLRLNPYHMLKPFSSMSDALRSKDIQFYVDSLRSQFPPEQVEKLVQGSSATPLVHPTYDLSETLRPQAKSPFGGAKGLTPSSGAAIPVPAAAPALAATPSPKSGVAAPPSKPMVPISKPAPIPARKKADDLLHPKAGAQGELDDTPTAAGTFMTMVVFAIGLVLAGGAFFYAFIWPLVG